MTAEEARAGVRCKRGTLNLHFLVFFFSSDRPWLVAPSYQIASPLRPVCINVCAAEELLSNSRFIIQLFYKRIFIAHRHHAVEESALLLQGEAFSHRWILC